MSILSFTVNLLLFQLTPLTVIVLVVVALAAFLLSHYVLTRRDRGKVWMTITPGEIMQKALTISGDNVILYDLKRLYVYKINGNMLPDEGISVEDFKQHVHPDDLDVVVQGIQRMRSG